MAQLEPCELVLLVSWTPSSGDETSALLADAARGAPGQPPGAPGPAERLRALYAARALAPLTVRADDRPLAPRAVEVKLLRDPPRSNRIAALALITYELAPAARRIQIANNDSHRTRFSLVDRSQGRFESPGLETGHWASGVASILLLSRPNDAWPSCHEAPH